MRPIVALTILASGSAAPSLAWGVAPAAAYPHEVVLPMGYQERGTEAFPLILLLHGAGGLSMGAFGARSLAAACA